MIVLKCMLLFSCRFLLEHSQSLFSQDVNDFSQNNDTTQFLREHQEHIYLMLELVVVIIFGTTALMRLGAEGGFI